MVWQLFAFKSFFVFFLILPRNSYHISWTVTTDLYHAVVFVKCFLAQLFPYMHHRLHVMDPQYTGHRNVHDVGELFGRARSLGTASEDA